MYSVFFYGIIFEDVLNYSLKFDEEIVNLVYWFFFLEFLKIKVLSYLSFYFLFLNYFDIVWRNIFEF